MGSNKRKPGCHFRAALHCVLPWLGRTTPSDECLASRRSLHHRGAPVGNPLGSSTRPAGLIVWQGRPISCLGWLVFFVVCQCERVGWFEGHPPPKSKQPLQTPQLSNFWGPAENSSLRASKISGDVEERFQTQAARNNYVAAAQCHQKQSTHVYHYPSFPPSFMERRHFLH